MPLHTNANNSQLDIIKFSHGTQTMTDKLLLFIRFESVLLFGMSFLESCGGSSPTYTRRF